MQSITYEQSIKFGQGALSCDEVSDEEIKLSLGLADEEIDCYDTRSIVYHVKLLMVGKALVPFEVIYQRESEYPHCAVIYDGWHRIRAYQYMKYSEIPCLVEKRYQ